jgi:hypothetical protein
MTTIEELLGEFPGPVRETLTQAWGKLSQEQREELKDLLGQLPASLRPLKGILSIVLNQYKPVFGAKRSIAVVGPANVGKSTLATTVAIGYAAMTWFAQGEQPTRETLHQITADVTDYLKEQLKGLGEKKPDRGTLRERITEALNTLPQSLRPNPRTSARGTDEHDHISEEVQE